jgi:isoquinoline 1-oxidoreductase alpha subunit
MAGADDDGIKIGHDIRTLAFGHWHSYRAEAPADPRRSRNRENRTLPDRGTIWEPEYRLRWDARIPMVGQYVGGPMVASTMVALTINGESKTVDAPADMPLLWVLRDLLGMTGTKFGCGIAQCGACTVHLDGKPVRSCLLPVGAIGNRAITTIEGVGSTPSGAKVQKAWLDLEVIQCGYCQSGQIMSAAALLEDTPHPDDADIDAAMAGNICRCGTYVRIREAIKRAADGQA